MKEEVLEGGERSFDPSENVKALNQAANARQDDLRKETNRRIAAEISHLKVLAKVERKHRRELGKQDQKHQRQMRKAEAQRLNSIRQVDREDVNKTASAAQTAIAALATTNTTTAETLRNQVASTKQASDIALANSIGEMNKRLSALELSSSEGKGQKTVADPRLEALVEKVERIATTSISTTGQTQGAKNLWAIIVGVVGLFITVATFGLAVLGFLLVWVLRR